MQEVYYEEEPRQDIALHTWELEIQDVLEYFKGLKIGNENLLETIRFFLASENKITSLSDTNETIMRNIAKEVSKAFTNVISIDPNQYGITREQIPFIALTFAKLSYQLCMKSVGGGERVYRGKIIKVETRTETKEEPSLKLPLKR